MPVGNHDVKQAVKMGKGHCRNLGAFENGSGPGTTRGKASELDENTGVDFERKGIWQMFAFLAVSKVFDLVRDSQI